MKPLHKNVKEASLAINDSPWANLSSGNSLPPSRLPSFTSRTQVPKFSKPTLVGGGPSFPGPINTQIPSVAANYHQYANSSLSTGSIGYITPVPATPLSAALGPAAQATVPNTPNMAAPMRPEATGPFAGNVFERADRLLSQSSRRV